MERTTGGSKKNPGSIAKPEDSAFFGETVDMGIGFPRNTSGESRHKPLDSKPKPGPKPRPVPRPRPDPRAEPFRGGGSLPRGGGRPPSGDPRRPIPVPRPREDVPRPRGRDPVRRHEDEYTRRV